MRDSLAVALTVFLIVGIALAALPQASAATHTDDDNPYPDVNPCASGVSDISGTIKVCTLIRIGEDIEVMTHPLRAMVWIQISATGPTAHVSDTLDGVAWVQDTEGIGLTQRDDWFVAIQSWNLPPDVELLPPIRYDGVRPDEARTFVFNCLGERCDRPAPTPTPSITSRPPNATREATLTPTMVVSTTPTATVPVTGTPSVTPTFVATRTMTPTATTTGTLTATATATVTATSTVTGTATATLTATVTALFTASATATTTPTSSVTPTIVFTATPTASVSSTATAIATTTPSPSSVPTASATSAPPTATEPLSQPYRLFVPLVSRPAR